MYARNGGCSSARAGRAGISSALIVDGRVFLVDCGRGSPSAFADAGLDFSRLEAVLITHLHADHIGDLPGMLIYPWGLRCGENGPLPPIRVYGPLRPKELPAGDPIFHRERTIHPELPAPGITELVNDILAAYAYHLNVMPLDARMPDPGQLVRAFDVPLPERLEASAQVPVTVLEDDTVRVSAVAVMHGRAVPAFAYRFDTPHGSVVFSGDTTVNEDLIALAQNADILVHSVADLDYLGRHGFAGAALERMAALHTDVTQVGGVAERSGVGELILNHYVPAEPDAVSEAEWVQAGTARLRREDHRRQRRPTQDPPRLASLEAPSALHNEPKSRAAGTRTPLITSRRLRIARAAARAAEHQPARPLPRRAS